MIVNVKYMNLVIYGRKHYGRVTLSGGGRCRSLLQNDNIRNFKKEGLLKKVIKFDDKYYDNLPYAKIRYEMGV